jgi:protein TonB
VKQNNHTLIYWLAGSVLLHVTLLGFGSRYVWQPPEYDVDLEPPPVVIDLTEWVEPEMEPEPPPPELEPEQNDIQLLEEIPPEPIPEPEPEIKSPEPEPVAMVELELIQPGYLRNPPPRYPIEARRNGWEGSLMLRVQVSSRGIPEQVDVISSSGYGILDVAARDAVLRWRFNPARLAGQPVSAAVEIPVIFKLGQ